MKRILTVCFLLCLVLICLGGLFFGYRAQRNYAPRYTASASFSVRVANPLYGGTISYNQSSREGGGVSLGWLNRNKGSAISSYITNFTMTGGTFTGNVATSTGGGLNIAAGRSAEIIAGYFTDNTANGTEYQPGDTIEVTDDLTVTALWEELVSQDTIEDEQNGEKEPGNVLLIVAIVAVVAAIASVAVMIVILIKKK